MIKNKKKLALHNKGADFLLNLADKALNFLQAKNLIKNNLLLHKNILSIQNQKFDLNKYQHIFVVGAGKATYEMAEAINKLLAKKITAGFINVPYAKTKKIGKIIVNQASHPLPNQAGVNGAHQILKLVSNAGKDDLIIALMSGGGSALMPLPAASLTLQEKLDLTGQLLKCSANIKEINTIRKHLSGIKGGRLAQAALPATMVALYISDVIGDNLEVIASGPTVPDASTSLQAINILKKYHINNKKINKIIINNESIKKINNKKIFNFIIGNNYQAIKYLIDHIIKNKYHVLYLTSELQGEAKEVSKVLLSLAQEINKRGLPINKPALIIAGGETTVKVKGKGFGGRNQELVLASLPYLQNNVFIMSLATDGVDGMTPKPMAGAVGSQQAYQNCLKRNLNINDYLDNNDSYSVLSKINCTIDTGLTGANVGDIIFMLIQ